MYGSAIVYGIAPQADGKLWVAGSFNGRAANFTAAWPASTPTAAWTTPFGAG